MRMIRVQKNREVELLSQAFHQRPDLAGLPQTRARPPTKPTTTGALNSRAAPSTALQAAPGRKY